jgi:hypothetical protein
MIARGTENPRRDDADQRQAEGYRTDDEASQAQHGRIAGHRSDHGRRLGGLLGEGT